MSSQAARPIVLLTGAAGRVATRIRPLLRGSYRLRLVDVREPPEPPTPDEQLVLDDLRSNDVALTALRGVRALVHLAGNASPGADWTDLEPANVALSQRLLEAAARAGIERVVLASSIHATGRYLSEGRQHLDPSWPPRPCCLYGASKVAVEALGSVYAHRRGLRVTCLRIGEASERPRTEWGLRTWSSPRDLAHLIDRSIAVAPRFDVYYAVSDNTRSVHLTTNARDDLGYRPVDDAEQHAAVVGEQPGPPCFGPCPACTTSPASPLGRTSPGPTAVDIDRSLDKTDES